MRRALEICKTLKDFETLLDTLPRPLYIDSNYGVMDATGGVAYYEVVHNKYVKYDANNPEIAPNGYLIRTNFGVSGDQTLGQGFDRYVSMENFVNDNGKKGKIDSKDVIRRATRFLIHGGTKVNLYESVPENETVRLFVDFKEFIPRKVTVSAQLIQGVRKGENPLLTFAWTICGNPLTTITIPIWMTDDHQLPQIVTRSVKTNHAPLTDASLSLKEQLFPSEAKGKLNLSRLINKAGTGILQHIESIEEELFRKVKPVMKSVCRNGKPGQEVTDFYRWIDIYVPSEYKKHFGIPVIP